jgi:hypothetical protein
MKFRSDGFLFHAANDEPKCIRPVTNQVGDFEVTAGVNVELD